MDKAGREHHTPRWRSEKHLHPDPITLVHRKTEETREDIVEQTK
jgi:hypothetical protein